MFRYFAEKEEFRVLKLKYDEILPQYKYEVEEAQYIERIMFEAKCREFIARRSVKKIQRWWRGIMQKKKAKKKSKKGKGTIYIMHFYMKHIILRTTFVSGKKK